MKAIYVLMMALVSTLVLNLPMQSYADPQLDTLLRITTQAKDNLSINLSQLTNIPSEISDLYKKGSDETDALKQAVQQQDVGSAKQHFLSAMQFFKATNDKINSLNTTASNDQQRTQMLTLQDEVSSIQNSAQRLRDIAAANNVDANFTEFDQMIQQTNQDLSNNDVNATSKDIQNLNQFVSDIHHYLATVAQQRTTDRAKDFTEKQIEKLNQNVVPASNVTSQATINSSAVNTNATTEENPQEMVTKLRTLISQGKIDEAIQMLKTLQAHQKNELENNSNQSTTQQNPANSTLESDQSSNPPPINNQIPTNPNNSTRTSDKGDDSDKDKTKQTGNTNNSTRPVNNTLSSPPINAPLPVIPFHVSENSTKDNLKKTQNDHEKSDSEKRKNGKRNNSHRND